MLKAFMRGCVSKFNPRREPPLKKITHPNFLFLYINLKWKYVMRHVTSDQTVLLLPTTVIDHLILCHTAPISTQKVLIYTHTFHFHHITNRGLICLKKVDNRIPGKTSARLVRFLIWFQWEENLCMGRKDHIRTDLNQCQGWVEGTDLIRLCGLSSSSRVSPHHILSEAD